MVDSNLQIVGNKVTSFSCCTNQIIRNTYNGMVHYETLNIESIFDWSSASVRKSINLCNRFLNNVS